MGTSVKEIGGSPRMLSLKKTEWWFPFAFVVAGYLAVWVGLLLLWREWMRRRWRATQEAGGM
jgi:hypothetical protein